jgi:hypothetical protein
MIIHAAPIEVKERVVAPRVASTKAFSMASLAADHRAANQQTAAATHTTHVTEVHVTNIVGGARGGRGGSRGGDGRRVMKKQASFLNQLRGKVLAPSAVASVDEEDRRSGALKSSFLSSMRGNIGKQ